MSNPNGDFAKNPDRARELARKGQAKQAERRRRDKAARQAIAMLMADNFTACLEIALKGLPIGADLGDEPDAAEPLK